MLIYNTLAVVLALLLVGLAFNNKSFSTLLLTAEATMFVVLSLLILHYTTTGLDYYYKCVVSTLYLFSFEIAVIIIIIYSTES